MPRFPSTFPGPPGLQDQHGNKRPLWTISEDNTEERTVKQRRILAFAGSRGQHTPPTDFTYNSLRRSRFTSIQAPRELPKLNVRENNFNVHPVQHEDSTLIIPTEEGVSHAETGVKLINAGSRGALNDNQPHKRPEHITKGPKVGSDEWYEAREHARGAVLDDQLLPIALEDLHVDVGEKYCVLRNPWQPKQAILSEDIFKQFGLADIAENVRRTRPDGSKKTMRKSYKGYIDRLGLTGQFKPVVKEPDSSDGLLNLLSYSSEDWNVDQVEGQDIEDGLRPEVQYILPQATSMNKGLISKEKWDPSVKNSWLLTQADRRDENLPI